MMGPLVGGLLAFGVIVGCLFRGLYLLNDIHKIISNNLSKPNEAIRDKNLTISPENDHLHEHLHSVRAYKKYLDEKNK